MDTPGGVPLHLELTGSECPLLSDEDIEVVVCSVQSSVSFRPERGTEDDEILRDACVDDVHGTHGTTSIVENPFLLIGVDSNLV